MKPTSSKLLSRCFQLAAVTLLIMGCGTPKPKPVAWNMSITKPAPIEVDLVAVTAREKARFEAYPLDKYWSPNDEERKNADKLTSPPTEKWLVAKKDPKWKAWKSRRVVGLFVIANLPGNFEGGADPRAEYLPLDKHHWDARRSTLEIEVKENRIMVLTPEKIVE